MSALLINPSLPGGFYNIPSEKRSESELLTWWDKPFAVKREDGTFDVQCLDGGAWIDLVVTEEPGHEAMMQDAMKDANWGCGYEFRALAENFYWTREVRT